MGWEMGQFQCRNKCSRRRPCALRCWGLLGSQWLGPQHDHPPKSQIFMEALWPAWHQQMTQNIMGHGVLSSTSCYFYLSALFHVFKGLTTTSLSCSEWDAGQWFLWWIPIVIPSSGMRTSEGGNGQRLAQCGAERRRQTAPLSSSLPGPLNPAATWTPAPSLPSASMRAAEHSPDAPSTQHPPLLRLLPALPSLEPISSHPWTFYPHNQMTFPSPEIERATV